MARGGDLVPRRRPRPVHRSGTHSSGDRGHGQAWRCRRGGDAAHKLAILASLCFGTSIDVNAIAKDGIDIVEPIDLTYAEKFTKHRFDALTFIGGGAQSDLWCQILADVLDRPIRQAAEPRLAEFAAFRDGQVWTSSNRMTDAGALDIYEQGVLRPDLVLADLIAIAHPDLLPGHEFTFYRRLQ